MKYSYLVMFFVFVSSRAATNQVDVLRNARVNFENLPQLTGLYRPTIEHPNVLLTPGELQDISRRTSASGSFSATMFAALSVRVRADLRSKIDWDGTYSGCDLYTYLHLFSFEPVVGYSGETRTEQQLERAAGVKSGTEAPKGAAVVAARLALYASLVRAGAGGKGDEATMLRAVEVAKQILTAWANHGFPRVGGTVSADTGKFCVNGIPDPKIESTIGLQISRGMIYYVFAQDLLEGQKELDDDDIAKINTFDSDVYSLLVNSHNLKFDSRIAGLRDCERYGNSNGSELTALLGIARVLNDRRRFEAVLRGGDSDFPIALNWTAYFNIAIYGKEDAPNACYKNSGPNARASHPSFNTANVVEGEIDDRFRNGNPLQPIGYSMFTLTHLYRSAEILLHSGYNPYEYRGLRGQSLETATVLFSCYGEMVGFGKIIDGSNGKACPNFPQYEGAAVNGVEQNVVIGAFRYPSNPALVHLKLLAEKSESTMVVDPLLFGLWQE